MGSRKLWFRQNTLNRENRRNYSWLQPLNWRVKNAVDQSRYQIMKFGKSYEFHKNSFGQERTNEIWNFPALCVVESSLYTLQQSFMKFGKSYEFHKNSFGQERTNEFRTFHNGIKSVHLLRHLIMKCMNYMMHFHIQTITLHWMIWFWFWVGSSPCDIMSNPILFNHKMGFTNLLNYDILL